MKISIFDKNSIFSGIGKLLVYGGAALCIVKLPQIALSYLNENRINRVVELIEKESFDEVEKILDNSSKDGGIEKIETEILSEKLKQKRIEQQIGLLESSLVEENPKLAESYYLSLKEKLGDKRIVLYRKKIDALSLESLLREVENSLGEERIDAIEKIVHIYPSYSGIKELRQRQLSIFLNESNSYFQGQSAERNSLKFLTKFRKWLKNQDTSLIKETSFSEFLVNAEDCLKKYLLRKEFVHGDRIKIVDNLGRIRRGEQGKEQYWYGSNTSEMPLGTKGYISAFSEEGKCIIGHMDNGESLFFSIAEIEPEINFQEYQRELKDIREYVENIKKNKSELEAEKEK